MSKSANVMLNITVSNPPQIGLHFPSLDENTPSESRTAFLTKIGTLATNNNVSFNNIMESAETPYPNYVYFYDAASSSSVGSSMDNGTYKLNLGATAIATWFASVFTYVFPSGSVSQINEYIEIPSTTYDSGILPDGLVLSAFTYD